MSYNKIVTISEPKTITDKIKVGGQLFIGTLKYVNIKFIDEGVKSCISDYKMVKSFGDKFNAH